MAINFTMLSILIVEDNKEMQSIIASILDDIGVKRIRMATNGEAAFNAFRQENNDVILCDWEMPEMGGIELVKLVRKSPMSPNRVVPVVMITGYNALERIHAARDAGVTEYVIKPFTAQNLISRLTHVINHPRDFVESDDYTGPDRRRRKMPDYKGPHRRDDDKK